MSDARKLRINERISRRDVDRIRNRKLSRYSGESSRENVENGLLHPKTRRWKTFNVYMYTVDNPATFNILSSNRRGNIKLRSLGAVLRIPYDNVALFDDKFPTIFTIFLLISPVAHTSVVPDGAIMFHGKRYYAPAWIFRCCCLIHTAFSMYILFVISPLDAGLL